MSILSTFSVWILGAAGAGIVGNLSTDAVKKLNKSFLSNFKEYYQSEEIAIQHLELMNTVESKNNNKPYRDVEDTFETLNNSEFPSDFLKQFEKWILENQDYLVKNQEKPSNGFKIGSQKAKGDINNVNGSQTIYRGTNGITNGTN